jgi:hypothetical protein
MWPTKAEHYNGVWKGDSRRQKEGKSGNKGKLESGTCTNFQMARYNYATWQTSHFFITKKIFCKEKNISFLLTLTVVWNW